MFNRRIGTLVLCLGILLTGSMAEADEDTILVCAAASLADAVQAVAAEFEQKYGTAVDGHFAGSNVLRMQIENGAPCDVYISANTINIEILEQQGLLAADSIRHLLTNRLVIITQADNPVQINSMEEFGARVFDYFTVADPETVPVGIYTREALKNAGLWEEMRHKVLPAVDARAALAQVVQGNVQFGVVYATDAAISDAVKAVYTIPVHLHSPIVYPACLIKADSPTEHAREFLAFLRSEPARKVFEQFGFSVLK